MSKKSPSPDGRAFRLSNPAQRAFWAATSGFAGLAAVSCAFVAMLTWMIFSSFDRSLTEKELAMHEAAAQKQQELWEQRVADGTADNFIPPEELGAISENVKSGTATTTVFMGGAAGALLLPCLIAARRVWKLAPFTISLELHGVRWGERFVLYEDITGVEASSRSVAIKTSDGSVLSTAGRGVDDLEGLEAGLRRGIQLAYLREDRPEARQAVGQMTHLA